MSSLLDNVNGSAEELCEECADARQRLKIVDEDVFRLNGRSADAIDFPGLTFVSTGFDFEHEAERHVVFLRD
jgi:hypothetical protein